MKEDGLTSSHQNKSCLVRSLEESDQSSSTQSNEREEDGAIEFYKIKFYLRNHHSQIQVWSGDRWKACLAAGGGSKRRYQYCADDSGKILYFRVRQGHSVSNLIDPTLQDDVLIGLRIFPYIYHGKNLAAQLSVLVAVEDTIALGLSRVMGPAGSGRTAALPDACSLSAPVVNAASAAPPVVLSPSYEVAASLLHFASLTAASPRTRTRSRSLAPLPKRAPRRSSSVASGLRGSVVLAESGLVTGLATKCCPPGPPLQLGLSRVSRALHTTSAGSQPSVDLSRPSAPSAPASEAPVPWSLPSNSDDEWDALLDAHGLTPSLGGAAAAVAQPADAAGASRRARDKCRRRQRKAAKRSMWSEICLAPSGALRVLGWRGVAVRGFVLGTCFLRLRCRTWVLSGRCWRWLWACRQFGYSENAEKPGKCHFIPRKWLRETEFIMVVFLICEGSSHAQDSPLLDVTLLFTGLEGAGGVMTKLIKRNTTSHEEKYWCSRRMLTTSLVFSFSGCALRCSVNHSDVNWPCPTILVNVVIGSRIFHCIYHIGCAFNLHSIINNRLFLGGQDLSRRQTVFFLLVDPRNEDHRDPEYIDFSAPRREWYVHSAWKRHQDAVFLGWY